MADAHRTYEIRCPVYGFVKVSDWEREIISQPAFQRLRRVRQLAWTDLVYPGAMHTRFEHSLGVMNMASMLYDGIVERSREVLEREFGYNGAGLERHKVLVRLAALLHDIGHGPFSHAAEELLPLNVELGAGKRYKHENYSAEIVRHHLADVIKNHPTNTNYDFTAEDIARFLEARPEMGQALFWRELVDGQMDADRMDYLLRDSIHAGVDYGRYDWQRLVHTVVAAPATEEGGPRVGVSEGGWHAAEGLIIARYFMFTQVYFHKTRAVFDYHLQKTLEDLLPNGCFPRPTTGELEAYLRWNDWRVLGLLSQGEGGEHGQLLANRNHFREVAATSETPDASDLEYLVRAREALSDIPFVELSAEKSWYKTGPADVPVVSESPEQTVKPLSVHSSVVKSMKPVRQIRLYVRPEDRNAARQYLKCL